MTKLIQLSQQKWAIVDDHNFEWLTQWRWSATEKQKGRGDFYAVRRDRDTGKMILMHREIMLPRPSMVVDHINGNPLDNRLANLRVCTQGQNLLNHGGWRKETSSQYKGVYRHSNGRDYFATYRNKYLGIFRTEEEAAMAYNAAAHKDEHARLNRMGEER